MTQQRRCDRYGHVVSSTPELLTIGELEQLSGTPITTLRYYERRGLIDPPARVSGQRRYEPSVIMRLMLIRFCRVAGLSLDDITEIINDDSDGREPTKRLAARRIEAIDTQLAELELARRMMEAAISCRCATVDDCTCGAMQPVIDEVRQVRLREMAAGTTTAGRPAPPRPPT